MIVNAIKFIPSMPAKEDYQYRLADKKNPKKNKNKKQINRNTIFPNKCRWECKEEDKDNNNDNGNNKDKTDKEKTKTQIKKKTNTITKTTFPPPVPMKAAGRARTPLPAISPDKKIAAVMIPRPPLRR